MYDKRSFIRKKRPPGQANTDLKAVALGYDPAKDEAPRVLASGNGVVAERILAIARENNIPMQEDPALVEALATLDLGAAIPPELYLVIAEVLAFVYRVTRNSGSAGR